MWAQDSLLTCQTYSITQEALRCILLTPFGTHSIFWVENVRGGWIVNNDDIAELSSEPAEVFDVVSSVKNAGFSKESRSEHTPLVKKVCHRVCILPRSQHKQRKVGHC